LYNPKTIIAPITIAPTTEPATIPPIGTELDEDVGTEDEVVRVEVNFD
jgi:hypothetical protein